MKRSIALGVHLAHAEREPVSYNTSERMTLTASRECVPGSTGGTVETHTIDGGNLTCGEEELIPLRKCVPGSRAETLNPLVTVIHHFITCK